MSLPIRYRLLLGEFGLTSVTTWRFAVVETSIQSFFVQIVPYLPLIGKYGNCFILVQDDIFINVTGYV